jgi:hypothetical protein
MKTIRHPARKRVKRQPGAPALQLAKDVRTRDTATSPGISLGRIVLEVEQVPVASARTGMPGLIRASARSGRAFLIHNARNPAAASALLINPDVLRERLERPRSVRTLSELLDALPFKRQGSPRLCAELPGGGLSELGVPAAASRDRRHARR